MKSIKRKCSTFNKYFIVYKYLCSTDCQNCTDEQFCKLACRRMCDFYLFSQGEGVVCFDSDSQDPLVAIDDSVRDGGESRVADLQTHTGDVPHTLKIWEVTNYTDVKE